MEDPDLDISPEEVEETDTFLEEVLEDVEGAIGSFFRGIFGKRKNNDEIWEGEEGGEEGDGEPVINGRLFGQNYQEIKASCLESGELFTDPKFTADDTSLFFSKPLSMNIEWKRPNEFVEDPQLFVDGADRFDINQGRLGDCWLLAAMANLSMNHKIFHKVLPPEQSFEEDYAGIFLFKFWQYGEWVEVVVDDYLPTVDGELVYIHSHSHNEFWSALMEKAYAKLHGTYENLKGGTSCEAMVDFSGGCSEIYELQEKAPQGLYHVMLKAHQRKSLNGCSIKPDPEVFEAKTDSGLIRGHAYSVTKVLKAKIETERVSGVIPLVRVRNPWGNATEWKGTWADGGNEWAFIPEEQQLEMGINFDKDGEWWMSYKDFQANFDQLELCNLSPDSLTDPEDEDVSWCVSSFPGAWVDGESAGGCRNFLESFVTNPQFRVTLVDVDEEDDDDLCTLLVSLTQKGRRALKDQGLGMLTIGFVVYQLKTDVQQEAERLGEDFFKYNLSAARSKSFINLREVTARFKLPPGTYVVVPSTYKPSIAGEFLLRLFTEKDASCHQHTDC